MTWWNDHLPTLLCNSFWTLSCLPDYLRFLRQADQVNAVQQRLLRHFLRTNQETAFGRQWHFSAIDNWETWAREMPIQDYEDFAPYVQRIMAGERNVLTAEPIRLLEPTSGSTGKSKLIPYTKSLQAEFQRAISCWIADIFLHFPSLLLGHSYWSISPPARKTPEQSAVPIGFNADTEYLGTFSQRLMRKIMLCPPDFETAGEFLASQKNLRFMSIWSPTFLNSLFHEDFAKTQKMDSLRFISVWGDATSQQFLPLVKEYFPKALIQPKGLLSTECFSTFPLFRLNHQAVLAYQSHFFEFKEETGEISLPQHLETGKRYSLIVTTGGGLYRYNTHDIVETRGFFHSIPILRFVGRDNRLSDYFGEKLNETFVDNACREAFEQCHVRPEFYMVVFRKNHYLLLLDAPNEDFQSLAEILDELLRKNFHYDNCRLLGQLTQLQCQALSHGLEKYEAFHRQNGMKLGDIKLHPLNPDFPWEKLL